MLGVEVIVLLQAHDTGANPRGVTDPQLVPQFSHQPLDPVRRKRRFYPHHRPRFKLLVKLPHFPAVMIQPARSNLPRLLIDPRHNLVARVHITSDKMLHGFGSLPGSPWS
jgi:hypothetical protein